MADLSLSQQNELGSACHKMTQSLEAQARRFAQNLTDLLNNTVTHGVRISAAKVDDSKYTIGRNLNKTNPLSPDLIGLTIGQKKPRLFLFAYNVMALDETQSEWLMASKTNYAVQFGDHEDEGTLFAYDYVRKIDNPYPKAHFHVYALHGEYYEGIFGARGREKDPLRDLHFPVGGAIHEDGGVHYRPVLEDIIEMLIVERLVDARPNWEKAINTGREHYYESQLKAAMRRNPDIVP